MNRRWINTKVEFIWDGSQYVEQSAEGYWYDGEMALCYTHNSAVSISGNTAIGLEDTAQAALNVSAASASANVLRLGNSADSSDDINIYLRSSGLTTFATAGTGDISLAGGGSASAFYIKSNDAIGMGTTSPLSPLHVQSDLIPGILCKGGSTDVTSIKIENTTTRAWNIAVGGSSHGVVGGFSLYDYEAGSNRFVINTSGQVGIGTTSPSYVLEVTGSFYSSGSSVDFKKHVTDMAIDSSAIYDLNPVSYEYKKDYKDFGYDLAGGKQVGLLSEDVAKTVPELAIMKDGKAQNVDYQKLSVLLLAEMKKLNKRLETLETNNG